jgi:hypothetical protein
MGSDIAPKRSYRCNFDLDSPREISLHLHGKVSVELSVGLSFEVLLKETTKVG